jgi:hypothetical protein
MSKMLLEASKIVNCNQISHFYGMGMLTNNPVTDCKEMLSAENLCTSPLEIFHSLLVHKTVKNISEMPLLISFVSHKIHTLLVCLFCQVIHIQKLSEHNGIHVIICPLHDMQENDSYRADHVCLSVCPCICMIQFKNCWADFD